MSCLVIVGEAICSNLQCCVGIAQGRRCAGLWGLGPFCCCCCCEQVLPSGAVHLCAKSGRVRNHLKGDQKNIFLVLDSSIFSFFGSKTDEFI